MAKVAVVGLGVCGLSVCARLARAGHLVEGFEQFRPGGKRGSSHGDSRIIRLTPGEGDAYVQLAARAGPLWEEWQRLAGGRLIRWVGGVIAGPPGSPFVRSSEELSRRYGHPFKMLDAKTVAREFGGCLTFPDGWEICRQDDCGVIHADAVCVFLERQFQSRGGILRTHCRVGAPITRRTLTVAGEDRAYDFVIVAAGSWAGSLVPEIGPLLSVERKVVASFGGQGTPTGVVPPVLCIDDDEGLFGMPEADGSFKVGLESVGTAVADPTRVARPTASEAQTLFACARRYLKGIRSEPAKVEKCLYTRTPDGNFLIQASPVDDRVLVMCCCSGHGFKYAPVFGEIANDWIGGKSPPELKTFGVARALAPIVGMGKSLAMH